MRHAGESRLLAFILAVALGASLAACSGTAQTAGNGSATVSATEETIASAGEVTEKGFSPSSFPVAVSTHLCENRWVGHLYLTNPRMLFGGSLVNRSHGEKHQRVLDGVRFATSGGL